MHLYNTRSRREEAFAPSHDNTVRMYTCGLTVYARAHIGNFRTFVALDVLRRALEHVAGYGVRQVRNYTDVDDRTILESAKSGLPLREYTEQFVEAFEQDARALGLEPVEYAPRATDHIAAMADMIKALERNGHTYETDGSVYFKISTFPEYGKLARLDHAGIKSGARVDTDKYDKENARDFVLWKAMKPGEPSWDLGLGAGRPGWHIECSAMAAELLGDLPIDIHGGGIDLIFPHHENEIAQAEGATNREFARVWVHVEHLMIDEEDKGTGKMSKSLGNVFTLDDIAARGFRPSALRYLYLGTHYRKQLRFSWSAIAQADEALTRLTDFLARIERSPAGEEHASVRRQLDEAETAFADHIGRDLNTAAALGVMFDLVRALNSSIDAGDLTAADAAAVRGAFERFDRVLGVLALRRREEAESPVPTDEIDRLIAERRAARSARNFAEADKIREDLESRGILLEDSAAGTRWKRK